METRKVERAKESIEGAQILKCPLQNLGLDIVGSLQDAFLLNSQVETSPQFMALRNCLGNWRQIGASRVLEKAIGVGVKAPMASFPLPCQARSRGGAQLGSAIEDYLANGAIRRLSEMEMANTKYWVPIFGVEKKGSDKVRVITDLRSLNRCCRTPHHKPETWKSMLETMMDRNLSWGLTLDLKGYYHNLSVHPKTARWMRFAHQGMGYQIQAMPFGWNLSSIWAEILSKPVRRWMHCQRMRFAWWVDDILLLGTSKEEVEQQAAQVVRLLTWLGLRVNQDKSMQHASQEVVYVGHRIDLGNAKVEPLEEKLEKAKKATRRLLKGTKVQPRGLAALAGTLVDQVKSNVALHGLPQQVMAYAARMVEKNKVVLGKWDKQRCWNRLVEKEEELRWLLKECLHCLVNPQPRVLRSVVEEKYVLQTDASNAGWGATLFLEGKEIATAALPWTMKQRELHITYKEALATALAVRFLLPRIRGGSSLEIQTDALATAWLRSKGSRKRAMANTIWRKSQATH